MNATNRASGKAAVTIYHNPACTTSRNVLAAIRAAGIEPEVVEYLKVGWTQAQLESLFARMKISPREALRARGTSADAKGLTAPGVSDDKIVAAMAADPVLVERPIVVTSKGAALCRPKERVEALL